MPGSASTEHRCLPGRRSGRRQHPGQHRPVGHRRGLQRRLHRLEARPDPGSTASSSTSPSPSAPCSKGDPKAVKVEPGHRPAERARRQVAQRRSASRRSPARARSSASSSTASTPTSARRRRTPSPTAWWPPASSSSRSRASTPRCGCSRPTLSGATNPGQAGTEIDVIEWFGKDVPNGGLTSFIYAPEPSGPRSSGSRAKAAGSRTPSSTSRTRRTTGSSATTSSRSSGTPSAYIFRIDGQETGRINKGISARPGVPDPQPAQLRLRAVQAARPGREEEPAPDDERRLDPHLAGPDLPPAHSDSHAVGIAGGADRSTRTVQPARPLSRAAGPVHAPGGRVIRSVKFRGNPVARRVAATLAIGLRRYVS